MANDFNPLISPKYHLSDFQKFEIDEKILVFEDTMSGWIFDICDEIIKLPNSSFATIKTIVSIFEMIGKYVKGYAEDYQSKKHFFIGFQAIYPDKYGEKAAELFYKYIRNPLYHSCFVSPNVFITKEISHPFGYAPNNLLLLNIHVLLDDLKFAVHRYILDLKNPSNDQLRTNFEKRFDYEREDFYNQLGRDLEDLEQAVD